MARRRSPESVMQAHPALYQHHGTVFSGRHALVSMSPSEWPVEDSWHHDSRWELRWLFWTCRKPETYPWPDKRQCDRWLVSSRTNPIETTVLYLLFSLTRLFLSVSSPLPAVAQQSLPPRRTLRQKVGPTSQAAWTSARFRRNASADRSSALQHSIEGKLRRLGKICRSAMGIPPSLFILSNISRHACIPVPPPLRESGGLNRTVECFIVRGARHLSPLAWCYTLQAQAHRRRQADFLCSLF
ncbi:hypothetical protein LY76DRAFT_215497 [Colletotrichum caudatum]|nr:hypothetical protein LY76DRAFT_215497 [Colletotrichum caudatum]